MAKKRRRRHKFEFKKIYTSIAEKSEGEKERDRPGRERERREGGKLTESHCSRCRIVRDGLLAFLELSNVIEGLGGARRAEGAALS